MRDNETRFHLYADDTQMYVSFEPTSQENRDLVKDGLESCVDDVRRWMAFNFLKLNDGKTEFLLIEPTTNKKQNVSVDAVRVGSATIKSSQSARNIGVFFECNGSLESHIGKVVQSSFHQLRCIYRIKKYLSQEALLSVTHAFVTSRLDSMNSLYAGMPDRLLSKLQRVQNAAARMVTGSSYTSHVTPLFQQLHWLPIKNLGLYSSYVC